MSSDIPKIPQPVPFQFHGRTDYTTVYKAIDFPLDHFAIFKQNPVNRDRITEANKMLYSLQKQINQLREALIALAMTIDTEVEKKIDVEVTLGEGAEPKSVKATLLDETYTVEIEGVTFGEATTIEGCFIKLPKPAAEGEGEEDTTVAASEEGEEMYIEVTVDPENPITCKEGGKVSVSGKAKSVKKGETIPKFTITKSAGPEPGPTDENIIEVTGTSATKTFASGDSNKKFVFKSGTTYYTATKMKPADGQEVDIVGTTLTVDADKAYTFTVAEAQEKTEYTVTVNPANSP